MNTKKALARIAKKLLVVLVILSLITSAFAATPRSAGTFSSKYLGVGQTITLFSYHFYHSNGSLTVTISENTGNAGDIEILLTRTVDGETVYEECGCIHGTGAVSFITEDPGSYTVTITNKTLTSTYISGSYTYYDY